MNINGITLAGADMDFDVKQESWVSDLFSMMEIEASKEVERTYYDFGELFFELPTPTRVEVKFDGAPLVVFSESQEEIQFPSLDLSTHFDHNVHLYLDPNIWKIHHKPIRWNAGTGKKCVACGRLKVAGKVYGCWLNMMSGTGKIEEWDTEHSHQHDEVLVQLYSRLSYNLLPMKDTEIRMIWPGEGLIIPAKHKHVLDTYNSRDASSVFLSIGDLFDMACPCLKSQPAL